MIRARDIRHYTYCSLRHTAASLMLASETDVSTVRAATVQARLRDVPEAAMRQPARCWSGRRLPGLRGRPGR